MKRKPSSPEVGFLACDFRQDILIDFQKSSSPFSLKDAISTEALNKHDSTSNYTIPRISNFEYLSLAVTHLY